ncbi:MAG: pyridoxal phosphate-dependent aminotransferase [Balneolales bacterium]
MIADRISRIAASQTLKITALAKEMKNSGKSVVSLSAGEPDFKTPKYICEAAIGAINDGLHGYTMNTGTPELRQAIVNKLKHDNNLEYNPSQIIVSNGAKQSIGFSILATVNPGDEVIIPAPYWVSYPEMVKLAEGSPVIVRTAFENEYKITPEQLDEAITPKTKMLILCSPSNPTGSCYTRDELKALAGVLLKYPDIYVISDEIYEYIVFESDHIGIGEVEPALVPQILLINGFSKGFAMTGWRLGYLAGPEDVVKAVSKIQSQETSAPSSISQKAGEAAYTHNLDEVKSMRNQFKKRRDYIVNALSEIDGLKCFLPQGAFYAFPDISAYLDKKNKSGKIMETSTQLCLYLLEDHGVALVPGDAFGEPNGARLSYAASMEDLKEAMNRLKTGLEELV